MRDTAHNRQFIRHPTDIPIQWSLGNVSLPDTEYLHNISEGGLAFVSQTQVPEGVTIDINIPVHRPNFAIKGVVVWCHNAFGEQFEIGVRFVDANTRFRMRMVEQVCHIEVFKREILETEGRLLTGEQAAEAWIDRYAKDFPR